MQKRKYPRTSALRHKQPFHNRSLCERLLETYRGCSAQSGRVTPIDQIAWDHLPSYDARLRKIGSPRLLA